MTPRERSLIPGTVDLVILKVLAPGDALHGFDVSRAVRGASDGAIEIKDAALYQALHRMEGQGWVASEWGVSENNRRAKFYRITRSGRRHLKRETRDFREQAAAVLRVLSSAEEAAGP